MVSGYQGLITNIGNPARGGGHNKDSITNIGNPARGRGGHNNYRSMINNIMIAGQLV